MADLHADTLMWQRDLLLPGEWGQADVPRLRQGGVDLQIFTVVTKTPNLRHRHGTGDCVPTDGTNLTGLLSVLQLRSPLTWFDLRQRALYQARRLDDAARRSRAAPGTEVIQLRTAADLARLVAAEAAGEAVLGALLGVEGAHWIAEPDGGPAMARQDVRELLAAGFRSLALTHRFDNALAGACEGCAAGGLKAAGAAALEEAEALGMVVDLSHLSTLALRDALSLLRHPPIVTHTGVLAHCPTPECQPARNLADADLVAIARSGGVIGIGFWPEAVGMGGLDAIVFAFAAAAQVLRDAGFDPWNHLAFGSDFDGAVDVPFDAAGLPALTQALRQGRPGAPGLSEAALARVAGGNVCRVLAQRLPGGDRLHAETICRVRPTRS